MLYAPEQFTDDEAATLRPYFTNLDGPVFALINLPEVVKGALFARYSRSDKSLRRLFLDEFVGDLDLTGDLTVDATVGLRRAEELYERVFFEYGDDSVAQLGGVHLACEQASNLLTKILEWGRLMAYLEQSTRYIPYDSRVQGRYRYFRPSEVCESPLGMRYVADLDGLFDTYSALLADDGGLGARALPEGAGRLRLRLQADDQGQGVRRGARRAARRRRSRTSASTAPARPTRRCCCGCAPIRCPRRGLYAQLMLDELRKVIPSFLVRVDRPDRGGAWTAYLADDPRRHRRPRRAHLRAARSPSPAADVTLARLGSRRRRQGARRDLLPAHEPARSAAARSGAPAARPTIASRWCTRTSASARNRRHKPGRAFERTGYRFDVLGDYGAFRDLQRHRMLTIEWQQLSPRHGYDVPEPVVDAGLAARFDDAMERSAALYDVLAERFPEQAAYAVSLAYRMRYVMQMNAREAMHLCELRSSPQGHPSYRRIAQAMHRLIAEQAGHRAIAAAMQLRRSRRQRSRATRRRTRGRSATRRSQLTQ